MQKIQRMTSRTAPRPRTAVSLKKQANPVQSATTLKSRPGRVSTTPPPSTSILLFILKITKHFPRRISAFWTFHSNPRLEPRKSMKTRPTPPYTWPDRTGHQLQLPNLCFTLLEPFSWRGYFVVHTTVESAGAQINQLAPSKAWLLEP